MLGHACAGLVTHVVRRTKPTLCVCVLFFSLVSDVLNDNMFTFPLGDYSII